MKYTLDTNCIIDLEEKRPDGVYLEKIISSYRQKCIELSVVAISASENQKGGKLSKTFDEFILKLASADLQDANMLLPMMYWDVAFWGHALWGDASGADKLEIKIHDILFPGTPIENPQKAGFSEKKWRNNKCDVQMVWAHIYHEQDILVTRDENFHKHSNALSKIGLNKVIRPAEFKP